MAMLVVGFVGRCGHGGGGCGWQWVEVFRCWWWWIFGWWVVDCFDCTIVPICGLIFFFFPVGCLFFG